jgi:hypothetical protein
MASARGANSAADGYSRFNDDIDNIEGSYQSNNISKLPEHLLLIISLFVFHVTHLILWVSRPAL